MSLLNYTASRMVPGAVQAAECLSRGNVATIPSGSLSKPGTPPRLFQGVDSFFEIRKLRSGANVILMTGRLETIVERALRSGAVGLLQKPFAYSVLLGALQALIARAA